MEVFANIFGIAFFKNHIPPFGHGNKAGGDGLQGLGLAVGRSGGQQEGCRLRAAQKQRIADSPRRAAVVLGQADRGGKADAVGIAREIDRCIVQVPCLFAAFAVQAAAQGESLRRIGRQPQDEHAIRVGDERLPRVVRAAHGEADVERARVQVKATAVVVGFGGQSVKIQRQIAQRLVCTHAARGRGQPIQREPFGIGQAALAEQFLDFGQRGRGVGVQAVHRAAAPQAVLIQLELLARDTTELHTAKASVARGQRRIPIRGGVGIPEFHRNLLAGLTRGYRLRPYRVCVSFLFSIVISSKFAEQSVPMAYKPIMLPVKRFWQPRPSSARNSTRGNSAKRTLSR